MNIDDVFHNFWISQSLDIFDSEFRENLFVLSTLRRIFRMTSVVVVVVVRLIEKRANQRTFAESNSKKKSIRRRNIFLNKRNPTARKSLNVSQTLQITLDAIFEQIIEYLFRKINLIDEWENTLIIAQNDYNDKLQIMIMTIDRRLKRFQISFLQIDEKIDRLVERYHNFSQRRISSDWSTNRFSSKSKTISKTLQLINISNKKKSKIRNKFFRFQKKEHRNSWSERLRHLWKQDSLSKCVIIYWINQIHNRHQKNQINT